MRRAWLIGTLLLVPGALAAQGRGGPPTVTVDASASVERTPDRAVLTLAVESEASTAQAASQANAQSMAAVVTALRRAGLQGPSVRTLSIRVSPIYATAQPGRREPTITGYRAVNMVEATIDSLPRTGAVIDAAIAVGANRVANLSFELKDPEEARLAALTSAMQQAKLEAETVARAAGRSLGPPLEISTSAPAPGPRPMFAERAVAMAQAVATPVEAGAISIVATVHVVYLLGPP